LYVFISYSREDSSLLHEFVNQLAAARNHENDIDFWYDKGTDGIAPGDEWRTSLDEAINRCDVFCIFLTSNCATSPNCAQELTRAVALNKRIVQLKVRHTALPVASRTTIPNSKIWIGSIAELGARDEYWRKSVEELRGLRSDPGGHVQGRNDRLFEELCEVVARLATFKHFHDVGHQLYEEHYKLLVHELKDGKIRPRTRARALAAIREAIADFEGNRKDQDRFLFERDRTELGALDACLVQCRAALDDASGDGSHAYMRVIEFGSQLGMSLTYFNMRIMDSARRFDVDRFVNALASGLASQQRVRDRLSEWVRTTSTYHARLLLEHDALQAIQDRMSKYDAEDLDDGHNRDEIVDGLSNIVEEMVPIVELWKNDAVDDVRHAGLATTRLTLSRVVDQLSRSVAEARHSSAEANATDLKRALEDCQNVFDKYFLRVDQTLKAHYRRMESDLTGTVAQSWNSVR
jgi:hypothetical protein